MEISVDSLKKHFEAFIDATDATRAESERARDYRDGKQWTDAEANALRSRGQAPIVINRIAPKIDGLMGIESSGRSDPKAFPRNPSDEQAAEAITDALRYVEDNTDFDMIASEVFEQCCVEGYAGVAIEVVENRNEIDIVINQLDYDRLYFDPHSRRKDFSDANYIGLVLWMDQEEAITDFPDKEEQIKSVFTSSEGGGLETFDDKPLWIDRTRKRIKVCQHYFKKDNVWMVAFFTGDHYLIEPTESPYLDEFGDPQCPIEIESAYVDRDNNRYGIARNWLDIQDEVNHRRSKGLHLLSVRQTISTRGAVDDVSQAKRELAKSDGHIEVNGDISENFQVLQTGDMAQAQFSLLAEAKQEIDAVGVNAALSGTEERNLSGRALQSRQQAGMNELGPLFDQHKHFKKRVYRQVWERIKQYWTNEKWVRVTDNEDAMKFVGLNVPQTIGEVLQDKAKQGDQQAQFALQKMIEVQDPRINQPANIKNNVAELDMDIIVETAPDTVMIQQEQFEMIATLAQTRGDIPTDMIIEASSLRNKKALLERLKGGDEEAQAAAAEQQQKAQQAAEAMQAAELEKVIAEADKAGAQADQINLENELLVAAPLPVTSVSI